MSLLTELITWLHDEASGTTEENVSPIMAAHDALFSAWQNGDQVLLTQMERAIAAAGFPYDPDADEDEDAPSGGEEEGCD